MARIDDLNFLTMRRIPIARATSRPLVLFTPGVDGVTIWETGKRGRPFFIETGVDLPAHTLILPTLDRYYEKITDGLLEMEWADATATNAENKIVVLDVQPIPERSGALLGGAGGLNPPSLAWLAARWELITVEDE